MEKSGAYQFVLLLVAVFLSAAACAQGGPPLVTDDPGTPGNGHWEINAAVQWNPTADGAIFQAPLFDVNYGYGDRIQLNLVAAWVSETQYGSGANSGASQTSAAVKWRFMDQDTSGVAISTYPRIDFHGPFSSRDPAINAPGTRYFLPLEFSKTFGKFAVNPEFGYAYYTQLAGEWDYGVAFSYELEKERELLFELHTRTQVGEDGAELLYDFGVRYAFAEYISFIGAAGHTLSVLRDESPFWNLYLGVQLRF